MPRSRKDIVRGRGRGAVGSGDGRRRDEPGSFVPSASISNIYKEDAHSLRSEALETQLHQSSGDFSNQRLRHTKVAFVTAGSSGTSEIKEPETVLAHMTLNETSHSPQIIGDDLNLQLHSDQDKSILDQDERPSEILEKSSGAFFLDSQGSEPTVTGLSLPLVRSISPTLSSSSDEVILFAGRDTAGRGLSKPTKDRNIKVGPYDSMIRIIDDKIHENEKLLAMNAHHVSEWFSGQQVAESRSSIKNDSLQDALRPPYQETKLLMSEFDENKLMLHRRDRRHHFLDSNRRQEQSIVEDYISNVEMHDMSPAMSLSQRDLGGTDNDTWQATDTSGPYPSKEELLQERDRSNLADFDVLSTSDEVLGSVLEILSKRSRKNGVQYLVVWEHYGVEETRWVSGSSLKDINSMDLIAHFEVEEEKHLAEISDENDKTDSGTDIDPAVTGNMDAAKDDTDLVPSSIRHISDKKFARLLAKQEELGMGSSELLIIDDSPGSNSDDGYTRAHHMRKPTGHGFQNVRNSKGAKSNFPAASDLADAYDGFDVMDFDRPSLKKKLKGRKGRLAFDISDSEHEESMAIAWDKGRSKKRDRKEERQALRLQGLLGKKETKPDLKAKYKEGMGIHAVKEEIKSFLMGDNSTLSLPPMDKADREVVHELANAFNLKSKSVGNGNRRFPVLYRTQRTSSYSENKFSAIEARITRRFLPRMGRGGRNTISFPKRSGRGGASNEAVSYRDGDIVGGSAPELGSENRGRAMLEKMGWSTGTALGALNNKGILQPVSHIVKTTKAGLG